MDDGARDWNFTRTVQRAITEREFGLGDVVRRNGEVEFVVAAPPKGWRVARRNKLAAMIDGEMSNVIHRRRDIVGDCEVNEAIIAFGYTHGELLGMPPDVVRGNLVLGCERKSGAGKRCRNSAG